MAAFSHLFLFSFMSCLLFLCDPSENTNECIMEVLPPVPAGQMVFAECVLHSKWAIRIWKCHFIFSHVRICLIAYLSTVPFILSLRGQFRLGHKAAVGYFSGSEWQLETRFWMNLPWISKNPVCKLHTACSCLPTWSGLWSLYTKRYQNGRERQKRWHFRVWNNRSRQQFWFWSFEFFSRVRRGVQITQQNFTWRNLKGLNFLWFSLLQQVLP